jgi:membrane protein DedA with SNARE-associated domain
MFDWIVGCIEKGGYLAIAVLMCLENVFSPIPSELIMPLAGFAAAGGKLSIAGVVAAGTAGSLAGALFWFWIGRAIGPDRLKVFARRHGRWLTLHPSGVDRARAFFERHQAAALFFGRLVPTVRTLISVPAGIDRLPLPSFLIWTLLGTALWTALLAGAGYVLQGQYQRVADWVNPVSNVIFGALVLSYACRLIRFRPD